ncbi:MAG: peptide chain release factor N(5)-glutamine methyltransferase [Xanthomonadales bacterium]|nr:peptide chain release factor N(5)-glutamine methyltransferase [Xanthomonadales bacterium]
MNRATAIPEWSSRRPGGNTSDAVNVRDLLTRARRALADLPEGAREAEVLLAHVLAAERSFLFAHPDFEPSSEKSEAFQTLVERRAGGEPVAYLTGVREFWSLPLAVTPDVLIPRPETELLVEIALEFLPPGATDRVADLGTGSGAVALAIARERPGCEVHATESSTAALEVARRNAKLIAPARVHFHAGSWLAPLDGLFRLVVSNPPYVPAADPHLQRGDCRFEPNEALTPGPDGLAAIRQIAGEARSRLESGAMLALEHGFDQGPAVRELLHELGYGEIQTRADLAGLERVTSGRWEQGSGISGP